MTGFFVKKLGDLDEMYNEIDLHQRNFDDALRVFITKYNALYKKGERKEIKVIHGYGSKFLDGEAVIRTKIRQFFSKNKDCVRMRIDLNPGVTYVMPLKNLPQPKKKKIGF